MKLNISSKVNSGVISCTSQNNLNFNMTALVSGFWCTDTGCPLVYKCTVKTCFLCAFCSFVCLQFQGQCIIVLESSHLNDELKQNQYSKTKKQKPSKNKT